MKTEPEPTRQGRVEMPQCLPPIHKRLIES